jgi:hypothetical protein
MSLQVALFDKASVSAAGITIDSEEEFDIMGDIFYVSVHLEFIPSQAHKRHFRYLLPATHLPDILPW